MVVEEEPNENEKEATRDYDITDDDDDDLQEGDTLWGKTPVDPVTTDCLTRLQRAPDQVLRYYPLFKEELLWIRSTPLPPEIPPCPDCGAERRCEFQLVPQMLHYVLKNQQQEGRNIHDLWTDSDKQALSIASELLEHAPPETIPPLLQERHAETLAKIQQHLLQPQQEMDWGTIAVYTCTASCSGHDTDELGAYREEYGWVQPPP
jgi:pre-rRNA-processing protein TSR4